MKRFVVLVWSRQEFSIDLLRDPIFNYALTFTDKTNATTTAFANGFEVGVDCQIVQLKSR